MIRVTPLVWDELLKVKDFDKHGKNATKLITAGRKEHVVIFYNVTLGIKNNTDMIYPTARRNAHDF